MVVYVAHSNPLARGTLTEFLNELGYEVVAASSLGPIESELRLAAEERGALVLEMAQIDPRGRTRLKAMHQQHPGIAVVVVKGNGRTLSAREAVDCGVHGYLDRTMSLAELELALLRIENSFAGSFDPGIDMAPRRNEN